MTIDDNLRSLRNIIKLTAKNVIDYIRHNNISRLPKTKQPEICMFCSSPDNITKEHVMPKWAFESSPEKFFNTDVNGIGQSYIKTTVPACAICNNDRLSSLEKYINKLFAEVEPKARPFSPDELSKIIYWLELIDFKFAVLNTQRTFKASKEHGFISFLSDFPIAVLRPKTDYSPSKALTEIRMMQKRLTVKNKYKNFNSLLTFKTTNTSFNFFHTQDDFIFIELPQYKIALFHFYKREFKTLKAAHTAAMKIIDKVYN